jgi:hypothetical protein
MQSKCEFKKASDDHSPTAPGTPQNKEAPGSDLAARPHRAFMQLFLFSTDTMIQHLTYRLRPDVLPILSRKR